MYLKRYSELQCIIPAFIQRTSDVDGRKARIWSASFKLDRDVSHLFPYLNAALDEAVYYQNPEHVSFLFNGYRCFLYPETASAHLFDSKASAMDFITALMDFLNQLHRQRASIRPNHEKIVQIPITDVLKILPKTNCQECGYPTCMAFAASVIKGKAVADQCTGLDSPISENALYPVFDTKGTIVSSVALRIRTADLRHRIQEQQKQIRKLEAVIGTGNEDAGRREEQHLPEHSKSETFGLTKREIEVLGLIAQGYTNNEISGLLFISSHTVKSHMINIFNKLNVNDRTHAAVLATRYQII